MKSISPQELVVLLEHFLKYGEISIEEVKKLKLTEQIEFLVSLGYLVYKEDVWVITEQFLLLLPIDNINDLSKKIFFSYPEYRKYLLTIATEHITIKGLEGAIQQVENIVYTNFIYLVKDINNIVTDVEKILTNDFLERKTIKDFTIIEIINTFNKLISESITNYNFEVWNKELLGVSGNKEAIFQAILAKKALSNYLPKTSNLKVKEEAEEYNINNNIVDFNSDLFSKKNRIVLFPSISEECLDEIEKINIYDFQKRKFLYSNIPLENTENIIDDLQKALCQHPISWLFIQLCILEYLNRNISLGDPKIKLKPEFDENKRLKDIDIFLDNEKVDNFTNLLIDIMDKFSFRFILPFGKVSNEMIHNLIVLMQKVEIISISNNDLSFELTESFIKLLFIKPYINTLNRKIKPYREIILKKLIEDLNRTREEYI